MVRIITLLAVEGGCSLACNERRGMMLVTNGLLTCNTATYQLQLPAHLPQ